MPPNLMRSMLRIVSLSLLLWAAAWFGRPPAGHGQAGTVQVRVVPPTSQVSAGQAVEIAVEAVGVQGLYGFDIILDYDSTAVEVVDADPGKEGVQVTPGTLLDPGFVVANVADNGAGRLQLAMTQLDPSEAKSGTGSLVVVRLTGKQAGASTPLTLEKAQLADRDGIEIPTTRVSGLVQIVSSTGGQPTNSPTPTQPPDMALPSPSPTISGITSTGTPAPSASTPESVALSTPSATPVPSTPEPGAPPATALSPTVASIESSPPVTEAAPGAVVSGAPVTPTVSPVTPQPTGTMVVRVLRPEEPLNSDVGRSGSRPDAARPFLLISIGLLVLAFAVGAVALVLAALGRISRSQ